jgi:hypothetical protein
MANYRETDGPQGLLDSQGTVHREERERDKVFRRPPWGFLGGGKNFEGIVRTSTFPHDFAILVLIGGILQ